MRLGIKARIGIRALFDLAFHGAGRQVQAREIAARQQVPERALAEVLQDLRKAGLVQAQRGPRGGYLLARPPATITVAAILEATGEQVEALRAFDDGQLPRRGRPVRAPRATVRPATTVARGPSVPDVPAQVWADVAARALAALRTATLAEFVARAEATGLRRAGEDPLMYFI